MLTIYNCTFVRVILGWPVPPKDCKLPWDRSFALGTTATLVPAARHTAGNKYLLNGYVFMNTLGVHVYVCTGMQCTWEHECALVALHVMEQVGKHPCSCSPGKYVCARALCRQGPDSGVRWSQLTRPDSAHLFPPLCSVSHVGSLKLAMVGVFVPWKSAHATNQDFFL